MEKTLIVSFEMGSKAGKEKLLKIRPHLSRLLRREEIFEIEKMEGKLLSLHLSKGCDKRSILGILIGGGFREQ